jgi:hypothetical protein
VHLKNKTNSLILIPTRIMITDMNTLLAIIIFMCSARAFSCAIHRQVNLVVNVNVLNPHHWDRSSQNSTIKCHFWSHETNQKSQIDTCATLSTNIPTLEASVKRKDFHQLKKRGIGMPSITDITAGIGRLGMKAARSLKPGLGTLWRMGSRSSRQVLSESAENALKVGTQSASPGKFRKLLTWGERGSRYGLKIFDPCIVGRKIVRRDMSGAAACIPGRSGDIARKASTTAGSGSVLGALSTGLDIVGMGSNIATLYRTGSKALGSHRLKTAARDASLEDINLAGFKGADIPNDEKVYATDLPDEWMGLYGNEKRNNEGKYSEYTRPHSRPYQRTDLDNDLHEFVEDDRQTDDEPQPKGQHDHWHNREDERMIGLQDTLDKDNQKIPFNNKVNRNSLSRDLNSPHGKRQRSPLIETFTEVEDIDSTPGAVSNSGGMWQTDKTSPDFEKFLPESGASPTGHPRGVPDPSDDRYSNGSKHSNWGNEYEPDRSSDVTGVQDGEGLFEYGTGPNRYGSDHNTKQLTGTNRYPRGHLQEEHGGNTRHGGNIMSNQQENIIPHYYNDLPSRLTEGQLERDRFEARKGSEGPRDDVHNSRNAAQSSQHGSDDVRKLAEIEKQTNGKLPRTPGIKFISGEEGDLGVGPNGRASSHGMYLTQEKEESGHDSW